MSKERDITSILRDLNAALCFTALGMGYELPYGKRMRSGCWLISAHHHDEGEIVPVKLICYSEPAKIFRLTTAYSAPRHNIRRDLLGRVRDMSHGELNFLEEEHDDVFTFVLWSLFHKIERIPEWVSGRYRQDGNIGKTWDSYMWTKKAHAAYYTDRPGRAN